MSECKCQKCQDACKYAPGWFKPGEAEKAAEYLEMSFKHFFDKYLVVNWWADIDKNNNNGNDIFLLSPALKGKVSGEEATADPRGECVFFENGLCKIHAVKPFECKATCSCDETFTTEQRDKLHKDVALSWNTPENQDKVTKILGHEPKSKEFGIFDFLSSSRFN